MWRNLLLLAGSLLFGLLLVEAGLRLIGYSNPNFYYPDPWAGATLKAGAEGLWKNEGRDYIRINSQGLRDWEHSLDKPADTLRVAVLGDSYTEALQLPMAHAYWHVAQQRLASCPAVRGRKVEFINFGVSGYGTAQELQVLRHRVWAYQPDIVVLAFLTGNDLRNNSRALEGDPRRPYFLLKDGKLVLDDRFLQDGLYRLRLSPAAKVLYTAINYSRVLQLLNQFRQGFRIRTQLAHFKKARKGQVQEAGLADSIYRPPSTRAWRDVWAVTEAILRTMAGEVKAHGSKLLVMTLSNGVDVDPDPAHRARALKSLGVKDFDYPDKRVLEAAASAGAATLQLSPKLRAWAEAHGECMHGWGEWGKNFHCGGHWNTNGHRITGELLAEKICQDLLP